MREHKYEGDVLYLKCSMCGEFKGLDCFNKDCSKPFGYRANCKDCRKPQRKAYYEANKDKIIERGQRWVENNRDKSNSYKRKYVETHKEHVCEHQKKIRASHTRGMGFNRDTFHQRAIQFVRRNGLRPSICTICGGNKHIVMHHPSYKNFEDWSNVVFCCHECHKKIHAGLIECPNAIDLLKII